MKTILDLSEVLRGFGDYVMENGTLQTGYKDLLVLFVILAIGSIFGVFAERIFGVD